MAAVLILVASDHGDVRMGPDALCDLAEMGITNLTLARGDSSLGIMVEGWAFDPERNGLRAATLLVGQRTDLRLLHVVTQMAVMSGPTPARPQEGGR